MAEKQQEDFLPGATDDPRAAIAILGAMQSSLRDKVAANCSAVKRIGEKMDDRMLTKGTFFSLLSIFVLLNIAVMSFGFKQISDIAIKSEALFDKCTWESHALEKETGTVHRQFRRELSELRNRDSVDNVLFAQFKQMLTKIAAQNDKIMTDFVAQIGDLTHRVGMLEWKTKGGSSLQESNRFGDQE